MASLGSLVLSIAVDTARFQGDLGRAASIAEARMKRINDTSAKALGALVTVGTAAATALSAAIIKSVQNADQLGKMAQSAGTSVESFSRLAYAANLSGVELETLRKALSDVAAKTGGDAAAGLRGIARQFESLRTPAERTALASKLFGERIGPKLVPLLAQGEKGLASLASQADRLGVTISEGMYRQSERFNDSLTRLRAGASGLVNRITEGVLPIMNAFADRLLRSAESSGVLNAALRGVLAVLKTLASQVIFVTTALSSIGKVAGAIFAALSQALRGNLSQALSILSDAFGDVVSDAKQAWEDIKRIWDESPVSATQLLPDLSATNQACEATITKTKTLKSEIESIRRGGLQDFTVLFDVAIDPDSIAGAWEKTIDLFTDIEVAAEQAGENAARAMGESYDKMSVFADQAARNMQTAFADFLFDPFEGGLKGMLKSFIDTLRRMVAEAAAARIFEALGLGDRGDGGFFGKIIGGLFGGARANGGPVHAGKAYLVGERGPELFVPGQSGVIAPRVGVARGVTYAPVYNFSGTSQELAEFRRYVDQKDKQTMADMARLIRGGAFA